jgi:hypothetical protein
MGHENNITKSYTHKGKTYYYNTPDPKHKTPDESLPKEYGKQYDNLEKAVEGAKAISKKLDKYPHKHEKGYKAAEKDGYTHTNKANSFNEDGDIEK